MHGPDPSWCARLHGPFTPRPPLPQAGKAEQGGAGAGVSDDTDAGSRGAVDALPVGSPFVAREVPSVHECEICGRVMYDHNCKIVCPNCGYKRDCSDP
jgi:hypothetical protein